MRADDLSFASSCAIYGDLVERRFLVRLDLVAVYVAWGPLGVR